MTLIKIRHTQLISKWNIWLIHLFWWLGFTKKLYLHIFLQPVDINLLVLTIQLKHWESMDYFLGHILQFEEFWDVIRGEHPDMILYLINLKENNYGNITICLGSHIWRYYNLRKVYNLLLQSNVDVGFHFRLLYNANYL